MESVRKKTSIDIKCYHTFMILLILFAFLAGIVTILSPCILPVLPIILSSSVDTSGKKRPLGVVIGFIFSFTFFTLFLSSLVKIIGVPADWLRYFSIFVLIIFGISLLIPKFQLYIEKVTAIFGRFSSKGKKRTGFIGGVFVGLSLGLLWTPCVGPILASVISLAVSGSVTTQAIAITCAYSIGTAIPMFLIMLGGSTALRKVPWLTKNTLNIQRVFGVVMLVTALGIFFNIDRLVQTFIITQFPQYGVGLTKIEDNDVVKQALTKINNKPIDNSLIGKPTSGNLLPQTVLAPELIPGGDWYNSKPLKLSDLRGKVVIIDFWTYSCINCQRTLPYLKKWWNTYKDKGLVIIGVHSPEFEFEKNSGNVSKAIKDFQITYPVVQDNNFATWQAYSNQYWPAKYFVDAQGYIRFTHFGEGSYDESEQVIQTLLKEAGAQGISQPIHNQGYQLYGQTPETYVGMAKISNFATPEQLHLNTVSQYTSPNNLTDDQFAFTGNWNVMNEYANPQAGAQLLFNFDAKEVYLVMRPNGSPVHVKVFVDDKQQYPGVDVKEGVITVDADRLYHLVSLPMPGRHMLRLEFEDNTTQVFAFTFG